MADPFKDLIIQRKKGETVYSEEDPGNEMYVVQSGAISIYRERNGVRQELAVMEKGDFFGELAVLEGLPRSTSAEAVEDTALIEINSSTFDKMIRGNIEIAVRMLRKLSNRLQEANRKIETMSAVPPEDRGVEAPIVAAVDLDRPTEAAPRLPDASPGGGLEAAPKPMEEVEVPQGAFGVLVLEGGERHFPVTSETAVIGRYDPVTGTRPEIDLTQVDVNRSISRRHARLVFKDGAFLLSEEVGALNGTMVNGHQLTPGQQSPLANGDKLSLGMVSLFLKTAPPQPGGPESPDP